MPELIAVMFSFTRDRPFIIQLILHFLLRNQQCCARGSSRRISQEKSMKTADSDQLRRMHHEGSEKAVPRRRCTAPPPSRIQSAHPNFANLSRQRADENGPTWRRSH